MPKGMYSMNKKDMRGMSYDNKKRMENKNMMESMRMGSGTMRKDGMKAYSGVSAGRTKGSGYEGMMGRGNMNKMYK